MWLRMRSAVSFDLKAVLKRVFLLSASFKSFFRSFLVQQQRSLINTVFSSILHCFGTASLSPCRLPSRHNNLELHLNNSGTNTITIPPQIYLYHSELSTAHGDPPDQSASALLGNPLYIYNLCQKAASHCHQITQAVGRASKVRQPGPSILFVGGHDQCGLKVRNLITLWKQQQHIKLSLLESSSDERCRLIAEDLARRQSEWIRKFAPAREAQNAKTVVISNSAQTTAFDPAAPSVDRPPPSPRTIRKRVNQYIHDIDVAEQLDHLRTLQLQGRWLDWSRHMHQDLSWQRLIHNWSDAELSFALQATTDTAPTATNLRRWGVSEDDPACIMCGKPATLRHVLNGCPVALHQGRYTWRHNSVLSAIRHRLSRWTPSGNSAAPSSPYKQPFRQRKKRGTFSSCAPVNASRPQITSRSANHLPPKPFFFKRMIGHFSTI